MLEKVINATVKVATVTTTLLVLGTISLVSITVSKAALKDLTRKTVSETPAPKKAAKPKTSGK